ncbi:hypothetical protein FAES_2660 [Fibrella aestuarina BUZ 2]|uniref:Uncharacterized protein n=1 Tax=Fibrella aestuarina BUZ 2 TaxID=1166018 RepID=I0K966_9BACT|nr:hypothetical protein [Fibrella aestuarina]CCH00669.1 hypothetical protein FAES_2660 [Fibrella aestuarina BUZ 2]
MDQDSTYLQWPGDPAMTSSTSDGVRRRVGISAAALLLGGGAALGLIPRAGQSPQPPATPTGEAASLPPSAAVATTVDDSMPFGEAFAAARAEVGPGGVFRWHGQAYNTFWQEEWADLSLAQRQEYAEQVLNTELPVRQIAAADDWNVPGQTVATMGKPTVIEGYVAGRRVMGVDDDNDGTIDALVIAGEDGTTYKVVDRTGDAGLDTLYEYDTVAGEYQLLHALPTPTVLTNGQLSANLEEAMSRQVINDLLADKLPSAAHLQPAVHVNVPHDAHDDDVDDSYINNGDVDDMDDPPHDHDSE